MAGAADHEGEASHPFEPPFALSQAGGAELQAVQPARPVMDARGQQKRHVGRPGVVVRPDVGRREDSKPGGETGGGGAPRREAR